MSAHLELTLTRNEVGEHAVSADVDQVLLLGYTGRDRAAVVKHIEELRELGVAAPPRVPMIYTVSPALLTTAERIEVDSSRTAGEAEIYVVQTSAGVCVGVGSDHTDREQERIDVAHSKGLCQKVLSREVWLYADVAAQWDQLELRAWATVNGQRHLYQQGALAELASVPALLEEVERAGYQTPERTLLFGGTLSLISGFAYAERFEAELHDPHTGRGLRCGYDVIAVD
jgi:hypothetical protein